MACVNDLPFKHIFPFNHLDDVSFSAALYEMSHGPITFDFDRLDTLVFNPVEHLSSAHFPSTDLDPDSNFYATSPYTCNYMVENEIKKLATVTRGHSDFSLLHLNCRSLLGHFDDFKSLIANLHKSFCAIGISETWLNDQTFDLVNVPGYCFISNHRSGKTGGGVGLYLQDHLQYKLLQDCTISNPDVIESMFVEIPNPHGKNIIVGTVYRPPNQNLDSFMHEFNKILSTISKDNKQCYLMGDFNLDLLRYDQHSATQEFVDSLFSHMFIPLITRPTRITSHTATLIDNIFTNSFANLQNTQRGIILNDISDHLPVFAFCNNVSVPCKKSDKSLYKRDFGEENLTNFHTSLSQVDWSNVVVGQDPNIQFNAFASEYNTHFEECFPHRKIKLNRSNKSMTPWISKGLLVSIKKKNGLYKKLIKNTTPARESQYKTYKNKLNHLIRIAKRFYYDNKFEQAKDNLKETWRLINEVINKDKKIHSLPSSFKSGGKIISDPLEIANGFCKYFTNVGPNLASKIPTVNVSFQNFLGPHVKETIFLRPITFLELYKICMSLKVGKAPGVDGIPMQLIKGSFQFISEPLMRIINLSLENGIFPDKLKTAKVIPIYKADDPELFNNYRPISILSNFSKIFERVMYNRLIEFIEKFEILYCYQFGFRKNNSTNFALIHLTNKIATAIDQNKITAGVFVDLSKAFDTLNHQILFSKLERYGIRGVVLQWIKSYFENREQFVQHDVSSSKQIIQCGVPQGSILGPLFFILYINDLPNALRLAEPLLFADDTSIYYSHSDPLVLATVLNQELSSISLWMKANKLSVNTNKTNYVIFKPKQKKLKTIMIPLMFNENKLTQKRVVKFLGVFIDENLSWKFHIDHVCKKVSKSTGIIYRSRFLLSMKTKLSLYYTLIYPYLTYCNVIWSSTYVTNVKRLFLNQKRLVRALTNADFTAHTAPLFYRLNLLDIYKINFLYIVKFIYCYHYNLLPSSFHNIFITSRHMHSYNTRNANAYRPHTCRTNIKKFTILFQGPQKWNSLPENIKNSETLSCFRNRMLKYLI